jgi:dTDP-glucose pyrophosphorylase
MFVFPMLGRSTRFYDVGYSSQKYKLPIGRKGEIVLDYVIRSFHRYFETDLFVFICRSDQNDGDYLDQKMRLLGIKNYEIKIIVGETAGQAASVEAGTIGFPKTEELFIFNIDTILYDFEKLSTRKNFFGYLEVFEGEGEHWSFAEISQKKPQEVLRVVEKEKISNLCSNGLYYFRSLGVFLEALTIQRRLKYDELYVGPLFNHLIQKQMRVTYKKILKNEIGFCGTPKEYEELKNIIGIK